MSPDGTSGWYVFNPDGSWIGGDEEPWEAPPEGSTIRLMGEDSVDVPLWSEDGLMFAGFEELVREMGTECRSRVRHRRLGRCLAGALRGTRSLQQGRPVGAPPEPRTGLSLPIRLQAIAVHGPITVGTSPRAHRGI
jgi:hypothetical protein